MWLWATAGAVFVGLMTITLVVFSPAFTSASRRRIRAIDLYLGTPSPDRTPDDRAGTPSAVGTRLTQVSERLTRGRDGTAKAALLIERADLPLRTSEWYVLRGLAVLVGLMGGWFLLRGAGALVLLGILLGAVLGLVLPPVVLKVLAARRAKKFEQQLPDVLTLLASSLATGFSLPQAIDAIVRDAAEPSAKEFSRALAETRIGAELEDSLDRLSHRLDSVNLRWTTMAVRIQRQVGGNLAETLRTTATTLRERESLKREVSALSAEGRLSAYILIALPVGSVPVHAQGQPGLRLAAVDHPAGVAHVGRRPGRAGPRRGLDEERRQGGGLSVPRTCWQARPRWPRTDLRGGARPGWPRTRDRCRAQPGPDRGIGRGPARSSATTAPPSDRLLKPFYRGTRDLALRLSPSGAGARLDPDAGVRRQPADVDRRAAARGQGRGAARPRACSGLLLGGGLTPVGLLVAAGAGAAGFFLPDLLVYNLGLKRQEELRRGLADALDMLTVCVEAGQGFDAALLQVSRSTTGPVAGEFARVLQEIQIGKPRAEAFSGLSQRTNVPEVKTFVTALVQADRLGLPIGAVLREQSNQMRLVRRQRAGEKAQKVHGEDPLPAAVLHLPGADDRRHRPRRDPDDGHRSPRM